MGGPGGIELLKDGTAVDLTAALAMAYTTGLHAAEALSATSHNSEPCVVHFVGIPCVILMDVGATGPVA